MFCLLQYLSNQRPDSVSTAACLLQTVLIPGPQGQLPPVFVWAQLPSNPCSTKGWSFENRNAVQVLPQESGASPSAGRIRSQPLSRPVHQAFSKANPTCLPHPHHAPPGSVELRSDHVGGPGSPWPPQPPRLASLPLAESSSSRKLSRNF